ncbi:MAG: hypothetical protein IJR64_03830 [Bacteroidales bacterium]|nr:hypothetical protein [Bacteroidales bacterium]
MNTIQDLTDQLYREGVEKGNQEAEKIIASAREKEAAILSEARQQADDILSAAKKQAEELDKNTKAELKLFAGQSLEALKSEVVNLLNDKVVSGSVSEATASKDFMPNLLLTFVKNWAAKGELVVETADAKALTAFFQAKAADVLKQGLEIKQVNGLETDFVLAPADGSYKIQLGKQDFVEYFKEFLRPKLVEMLF